MNLAQLNYARRVAETGSFSEAAKVCCVTQPTLSNGIAQLEKELGGKLFRRTTRSVTLTRFGAHSLPLIKAVLEARDELESSAKSFFEPENRPLRIGLSPLIDGPVFSGALQSLKSRALWSDIFIKQCFLDDLEERLLSDLVDLALLPRQSSSSLRSSTTLYQESLYYIPPQAGIGHPDQKTVSVSDLENQPIILTSGCGLSDVIADLFRAEKTTLNRYPGQALSYAVVAEWAALGIAGGILPLSKIPDGPVLSVPLVTGSGGSASVFYEAAWNPDSPEGDLVQQSLSCITEATSSLSDSLQKPAFRV